MPNVTPSASSASGWFALGAAELPASAAADLPAGGGSAAAATLAAEIAMHGTAKLMPRRDVSDFISFPHFSERAKPAHTRGPRVGPCSAHDPNHTRVRAQTRASTLGHSGQ